MLCEQCGAPLPEKRDPRKRFCDMRCQDANHRKSKKRQAYLKRFKETGGFRKTRRTYRLKQYGITIDQYKRMETEQGGVCAICSGLSVGQRLAVDHCHKTSKVRGLLCMSCNTNIGKWRDDLSLLYKAIEYLRKHGAGEEKSEEKSAGESVDVGL